MDTHKVDGVRAHTSKIFTIEGWGIQIASKMLWKKNEEDNQMAKKVGRAINQAPTLQLKHDKI